MNITTTSSSNTIRYTVIERYLRHPLLMMALLLASTITNLLLLQNSSTILFSIPVFLILKVLFYILSVVLYIYLIEILSTLYYRKTTPSFSFTTYFKLLLAFLRVSFIYCLITLTTALLLLSFGAFAYPVLMTWSRPLSIYKLALLMFYVGTLAIKSCLLMVRCSLYPFYITHTKKSTYVSLRTSYRITKPYVWYLLLIELLLISVVCTGIFFIAQSWLIICMYVPFLLTPSFNLDVIYTSLHIPKKISLWKILASVCFFIFIYCMLCLLVETGIELFCSNVLINPLVLQYGTLLLSGPLNGLSLTYLYGKIKLIHRLLQHGDHHEKKN